MPERNCVGPEVRFGCRAKSRKHTSESTFCADSGLVAACTADMANELPTNYAKMKSEQYRKMISTWFVCEEEKPTAGAAFAMTKVDGQKVGISEIARLIAMPRIDNDLIDA